MEVRKSNIRTRKVIDYAAMNGDRSSDDSDNDFIANTKISKPSATTSKPPKLSKLKLGTRKETKLPKCNEKDFTELKPVSDQIITEKEFQPPMTVQGSKVVEEMDFSMAEPDLMIHSIFSQETVITSSCGCLSSHELTDSSDSETFGTTFELSATEKKIQSVKKIISEGKDFKHLKTSEDKIVKRRIIIESDLNKTKKIKIESQEIERLHFPSDNIISKLAVDDCDNPLPPLPSLSSCLKMGDRSISLPPEKHIPHFQNLTVIASLNEDSEIPKVVQDKNIHSSIKQKIYVPKDSNRNLKKTNEHPKIPSANHQTSVASDNQPVIESSTERVSTPKLPKKTTKNETKHNLSINKLETKLKDEVIHLEQSKDKSRDASKLTAINNSLKVDNGLLNNDDLSGLKVLSSKNIKTTENPVHIFKPPSPPSKKVAVKWKPPGKAGGDDSTSLINGNSPATGIRLGLSRNRRASKPLHPDVKVKI